MTITLNGTTGITTPAISSDAGITADGISFADGTPANTLVTTTGGNVGIGTSSPSVRLSIQGATSDTCTIQLKQTDTGGHDWRISSRNSGQLQFNDDTAGAERMRIDSSGNFLVGTTSSFAKLTVSNSATTGTTWAARFSPSADGGTYYLIDFRRYDNNAQVGYISSNGTSTSYVTSSDYRLKDNVQPMQGALATVAQLKPVTYTWKSDSSDGQGFIAHELQEVCPDAVHGEKDAVYEDGTPKYQGIDTSFLVATLTAAIQEQQALITQLQADVAALKGQA